MFLRKRNKAVAIALALVFCMSFVFAGVVAPQAAVAATMYQVIKAPTVTPVSPAAAQNIGSVVKVTIPDMAIAEDSILTVSMPSDWTFPNNPKSGITSLVPVRGSKTGNIVEIVAGGTNPTSDASNDDAALGTDAFAAAAFAITPNKTFDLKMADNLSTQQGANRFFYIYFNGVNLNNAAGDLIVNLVAPSGSTFETALNVVIGKSSRNGATTTTIKKVKEIAGDDTLDIITIMENSAGSLDLTTGNTIKLKILTKGFTFDSTKAMGLASYGWDFTGVSEAIAPNLTNDDKELTYRINSTISSNAPFANPGKLSFVNLPIAVDDTVVKANTECEIQVSGSDMTKTTLVVAKYVDFGLKVADGTAETVLAGIEEEEVGNFFINESAAGSWVPNRTVTFTLPSGAQWADNGDGEINIMNSSDIGNISYAITGDNSEYLKVTLDAGEQSTTSGASVELSGFDVNVSPDFKAGTLSATVSGNAGVTGSVKLADVKPVATISVSELKNIEIGRPNQQIGDITITESAPEALLADDIVLLLDPGYRFAKVPTVKVSEGDLDITTSGINIDENALIIPVKTQSAKTAGKILISDIYVDAYRTAPEGKVNIKFNKGDSALNEIAYLFPNAYPGVAQVAVCVTPAPGEKVGNGEFRIGSNIYYVSGVAKVMDVAPYIKGGRTYVPMRYLGEIVGAEVVWDATAKTVTLTQGNTKVVFTVGSTSYTLNGETKTMDVAPEIVNDRTMLPARFVAEAFGSAVGWNAALGQVIISK